MQHHHGHQHHGPRGGGHRSGGPPIGFGPGSRRGREAAAGSGLGPETGLGPESGFGPGPRSGRGPGFRSRPGFGSGDAGGDAGLDVPFGRFDPDRPFGGGPFDGGHPGGRGGHRGRRGGRPGGPRGTGRARRGDVRLALLGLLAETPMNGYQLIKALEERTAGRWRPSPGAVYPALAQLQDEGLVEPSQGDGKVFRLTDAGAAEADQAAERARPWEAMAADQFRADAGPVGELSNALGNLGVAARAAAQSADEAVIRAVAGLLEENRRGVYRLLADGVGADEPRWEGTDGPG